MSTDWREKEREFLASLKADTGRDLGQWMALISIQGLPHRNDIIDWLRRQGFMFSRASWLERIHHNGGQPIYITVEELAEAISAPAHPSPALPAAHAAMPAATPATVPALRLVSGRESEAPRQDERANPSPDVKVAATQPASVTTPPAPERSAQAPPPADLAALSADELPPATEAEVAEVVGKAKAYRPLAIHLLRALRTAIPDLVVAAGPGHLALARNRVFALLAVSGKDLRLAIALPGRPLEAPLDPVKLPVTLTRAAEGMTHMIVLTDARQVDGRLVALVKSAAGVS
ncbi:MAG: hypothetical protein JNM89_06095 [Hyphomicrobiaceae bacterium]|nr:hypothetical protein [Hyphomicrobiaceae bacterium]